MPSAPRGQDAQIVDLFLCHNGADKDWVRQLAEQVESETFDGSPGGRRLRVFFDEWDIDVGDNVIVRLNDGLRRARCVGIVLSPDMLAAPWPTLEWTDIVAGDPINQRSRLIPIFLRDGTEKGGQRIELPAPFKALHWLDFRQVRQYRSSYQRLIRKLRDKPPARGRARRPLASLQDPATPIGAIEPESAAAPDRINEAILGNLLPVESYPTTIWNAPTEARKPEDVFTKVENPPAFELKAERLLTFADLSAPQNPFAAIVDNRGVASSAIQDWRDDPDHLRWFMSLLNRCLHQHLRRLFLKRDERGRYFFLSDRGRSRKIRNSDDPAREVAAKKTNPATGAEFWVHQAAWLRFQSLGDSLYLLIDPCYVFTADGERPLQGSVVGPLSMQWTGKERNAAILRHIVFWSRTLGRGSTKLEIQTGAAPIVLSGIPALARVSRGIEFDHIAVGSLLHQVEDELGKAAANIVWIEQAEEADLDEEEAAE
ncbi:MAG: toll/interleukin-1 receptor domain-containing protein [Planctomycetes bacterium]|nr:toll/interleukin-1 receptor domain-containing protein [Planctomycetota bacterium]